MGRLVPFAAIVVTASTATAFAEPSPALDDFFERTRDRNAGFDHCLGYCDGHYLAAFLIGGEDATPTVPSDTEPQSAQGLRLGAELGAKDGYDVVRTRLYSDILRVDSTGQWLANVAWHTTAFKIWGRPHDDQAVHTSIDNVVEQKHELDPSDVARLQQTPYRAVDTELEVAPVVGPYDRKNGQLTIPFGISNRLRWPSDGSDGGLVRRTSYSLGLALRALDEGLAGHAQLDILRVKYTTWAAGDRSASATTLSAGFQRLPDGLDTLPLWALIGYEWAGGREGKVGQIGMDLTLHSGNQALRFAPAFEHNLEWDPATAMVEKVTAAKVLIEHSISVFHWGVTFEDASVDDLRAITAVTPVAGVRWQGFDLGVAYRLILSEHDDMAAAGMPVAPLPKNRFELALARHL